MNTEVLKKELKDIRGELAQIKEYNRTHTLTGADINSMDLTEFNKAYKNGEIKKEIHLGKDNEDLRTLTYIEGADKYRHLDKQATDTEILNNAKSDLQEFNICYKMGEKDYLDQVRFFINIR